MYSLTCIYCVFAEWTECDKTKHCTSSLSLVSHCAFSCYLEQLASWFSQKSSHMISSAIVFFSIFVIWESGTGTSLPNKRTQCLRVLLIFLFVCFVKEGADLCLSYSGWRKFFVLMWMILTVSSRYRCSVLCWLVHCGATNDREWIH